MGRVPIATPQRDEDVVDADRALELREATDALCVAWELSGGARVADFNGLDFVELRGVTDFADGDAPTSFYEDGAGVMRNVARLLLHWRTGRPQ